jgi:protein Tex
VTTSIERRIARELAVREEQVAAAVTLLDDGATVRVKALEVDLARKRIALTLRGDDEVGPRADRAAPRTDGGRPPPRVPSRNAAPQRRGEQGGGALADALRRAGL